MRGRRIVYWLVSPDNCTFERIKLNSLNREIDVLYQGR
jgi:hypothetical protein